jgi:hypothetical protein
MASSARASLGSRRIAVLLALAAAILASASACTPGSSPSAPAGTASGAGTPGSTAPASVRTGVRGHIVAGPTCPVEMPAQSPCIVSVTGAVIVALDSGGHEIGRTTSDNSGNYLLLLPPGTYGIVPQPIQWFMGVAPETTVTVTPGGPVQLDLEYDTGLR